MKRHILVISSSLNPESRSRLLSQEMLRELERHTASGITTEFIDLQNYNLPICDGNACYGNPQVKELSRRIAAASVILVALPIYNYDVNSAIKNVVELTGDAWRDKFVGFLCAAGGRASYMAVMGLANSLMLDFRSVIIPRFVYADNSSFTDRSIVPEVKRRVAELAEEAVRFSQFERVSDGVVA